MRAMFFRQYCIVQWQMMRDLAKLTDQYNERHLGVSKAIDVETCMEMPEIMAVCYF